MIRPASPIADPTPAQRRRIQDRSGVMWRRFVDDSTAHPLLFFKEQPNSDIFENIMTKYKSDPLIVKNLDKIEAIRRGLDSQSWSRRVELHQRKFPFSDDYRGCRSISRSYGQDMTYLPSKVINTLYHDTHACIDMVNSHYNILANLFQDLDIPAIKFYASNRDEIIRTFEGMGLSGREVKTAFLALIGACPKLPSDFGLGDGQPEKIRLLSENTGVMEIAAEIKKCYDQMQIDYPLFVAAMTEHAVREGKTDHRAGVALSHLCFDVEDAMMRTAIKTLQNDFEDDVALNVVWKFDGAIVPKTMVFDGDDALRRMQNAIVDKYDIRIRFSFKPLNIDIFPECGVGFQPDPYQRFKKGFEKTYFKLLSPVSYCRIVDGKVEMVTDVDWNRLHRERNQDLVKQWEQDPEKRYYFKLGCYPPPCTVPYGHYNTWAGFAASKIVEPMSDEEIERRVAAWVKHVSIIMGHDMVATCWAHDLIAHMLQYPGKKSEKMIFVRSIQGVGKDQFTKFLIRIMGPQAACKIEHFDELLGGGASETFNGKILVVVSECDRQDFEARKYTKLKAVVTRETFLCTQKYEKAYFAPCRLNLVGFCNNHQGINMTVMERRFICADSDSRYAQNEEYHVPFAAYVDDVQNQVAVYRWYMRRDLSAFNPHKRVVTKVQQEMSTQSVYTNLMATFLSTNDIFENSIQIARGKGNPDYVMYSDDTVAIAASALSEEMVDFYKSFNWNGCDNKNAASQVLKKHVPEANAQATRLAPHGIVPIQHKRMRSPPGRDSFQRSFYFFHIPSIQKWMKEVLVETDEVVETGPIPTAFRSNQHT